MVGTHSRAGVSYLASLSLGFPMSNVGMATSHEVVGRIKYRNPWKAQRLEDNGPSAINSISYFLTCREEYKS